MKYKNRQFAPCYSCVSIKLRHVSVRPEKAMHGSHCIARRANRRPTDTNTHTTKLGDNFNKRWPFPFILPTIYPILRPSPAMPVHQTFYFYIYIYIYGYCYWWQFVRTESLCIHRMCVMCIHHCVSDVEEFKWRTLAC